MTEWRFSGESWRVTEFRAALAGGPTIGLFTSRPQSQPLATIHLSLVHVDNKHARCCETNAVPWYFPHFPSRTSLHERDEPSPPSTRRLRAEALERFKE